MKRFAHPDETAPAKKKANQLAIDPDTFEPVYPYNAPPLSIQAPFFNIQKGLTQNPPGFLATKVKSPLTFSADGSITLEKIPISVSEPITYDGNNIGLHINSDKGLQINSGLAVKVNDPVEFNNGSVSLKVNSSGGLQNTDKGLSIMMPPVSGLQLNPTGLFLSADTIWTGPITNLKPLGVFLSITQIGGMAHCLIAFKGSTITNKDKATVIFKFNERGVLLSDQSTFKGTFGKRTSSVGASANNGEDWSIFMPSRAFYQHTNSSPYHLSTLFIMQDQTPLSQSYAFITLNGETSSSYSIRIYFEFFLANPGNFQTSFGSFSYITDLGGISSNK